MMSVNDGYPTATSTEALRIIVKEGIGLIQRESFATLILKSDCLSVVSFLFYFLKLLFLLL